MENLSLPFSAHAQTSTLAARVARFFRKRPGTWIDGRELAQVAGCYGWRTRVSDIRRAPYFMTIENRQRRVRAEGKTYVISEYRFVPQAIEKAGAADGATTRTAPEADKVSTGEPRTLTSLDARDGNVASLGRRAGGYCG